MPVKVIWFFKILIVHDNLGKKKTKCQEETNDFSYLTNLIMNEKVKKKTIKNTLKWILRQDQSSIK